MEEINEQYSEYQYFTASLPPADSALLTQTVHCDTSQQPHISEPAILREQTLFSQHQSLHHHCMPQLQQQQNHFSQYTYQRPHLQLHQCQRQDQRQQQQLAHQEIYTSTSNPQIQSQSVCLPAVHTPPALQKQVSEHAAEVANAPLKQAPAMPEEEHPLGGGSALIPNALREALPATGSFGEHIGQALMEAEGRRLHLHDLYEYFLNKFSGLNPSDQKWRNSIRNKLTTSRRFVNTDEEVKGRRGGTWLLCTQPRNIHPGTNNKRVLSLKKKSKKKKKKRAPYSK
ncbi:hypothetical protein CAPTEDRAFT_198789 [Capitella teleta]|uniref:Fork-head domain-containing protein n=1 Tax=Capitella teleta TaxID=283909 RepID=R7T6D8_CAPTE|nr:hypothetical protein CAPTEDRAFT_198789 [Capitella teleta]|eukprot:ELT89119.1 hypothetical protein CAPTEDRAFT_198789 [Capitella teleta]